MLHELQHLHAQISALLDQLEQLTAQSSPPRGLAALRFRLTCASRNRTRMLEGHVYAMAAEHASPAQMRALQQLRDEGKEQLSQSQSHLARWDKRAIEADWAGYGRASRAMRSSMRRRIKMEREILYPLLEEAATNARPHRSRV